MGGAKTTGAQSLRRESGLLVVATLADAFAAWAESERKAAGRAGREKQEEA